MAYAFQAGIEAAAGALKILPALDEALAVIVVALLGQIVVLWGVAKVVSHIVTTLKDIVAEGFAILRDLDQRCTELIGVDRDIHRDIQEALHILREREGGPAGRGGG
jgi:hypothetical protein